MNHTLSVAKSIALLSLGARAVGIPANAQDSDFGKDKDKVLFPGNLVISRSVYDNNPAEEYRCNGRCERDVPYAAAGWLWRGASRSLAYSRKRCRA